jgi:hypothetical protein
MVNASSAPKNDHGLTRRLVPCGASTFLMSVRMSTLTTRAKDDITVGVANGERLPYLGVCSALPFSINSELFCIDFIVIALEVMRWCSGATGYAPSGPLSGTSRASPWCFSGLTIESGGSGWPLPACRRLLSPPTTICKSW